MKSKNIIFLVLIFSLVLLNNSYINAANASVQNYSFKIEEGKYNRSNTYSYKYYKGTKKYDKSAYIINNNSNINFYMYLIYGNLRYAGQKFSHANQREAFTNDAPSGRKYQFEASRQNWWDGVFTIKGSWSADDRLK
ncbi:MAG: hypothetical protein LBR40_00795 [Bacilli bacterium]|jgi:hypothetical protein|nr:hypothetical protein [Bacilli bacterium]